MSGEADAAGAAITAGLVGAAVDARTAKTDDKPVSGGCVNCGAPLSGKFCANCGQPAHLHHALLSMVEEFMRGLVIFDARAWRTLLMLAFRPGTLTHEYLRGKRVRYISPLTLFLFSVFTMFAVFAFFGDEDLGLSNPGARIEQVNEDITEAEKDLAGLTNELKDLTTSGAPGGDVEAKQLQVNARTSRLEKLRLSLQAARPAGERRSEGSGWDGVRAWGESIAPEIHTGSKSFDEKLRRDLLNPELTYYKIQNAAYKFAFLLVPISLPLVWLMFLWRRGVTLFDHTVYILYSLGFASLLFIAVSFLGFLAIPLVVFVGPVHAFFHLKGGYQLGWWSALWRMPFQAIFSVIGLLIFLVAIIALGVVE